ncbi:MAG: hypothetical protein GWN84_14000 [Gammaproteobacteria bacterium]|nr:hypothetical protein [Gammaproteobacteria bacterium]NIR83917.1 hypothetical protein [Gammaproteobacteria bacterium]NIU05209.1 hypothetical protein [Gammaproteobacteria bacterium]NIX86482.1 hypothetical protein [Gammaproteobacteria bacterium]
MSKSKSKRRREPEHRTVAFMVVPCSDCGRVVVMRGLVEEIGCHTTLDAAVAASQKQLLAYLEGPNGGPVMWSVAEGIGGPLDPGHGWKPRPGWALV